MRIGRTLAILLGLTLSTAAVVGVIFMGSVFNPPRARVLVARELIPAGSLLTPELLGVTEIEVSDDILGTLITEADQGLYLGYPVVETLYPYEPVRRSALSLDGNSAGVYRMALEISDPDLVAMPVPVDQTRAPNTVRVGDRVDIVFGASAQNFGNPLEPQPTQSAQIILPGESGFEAPPLASGHGSGEANAETVLYGPFSKLIITGAEVLDVVRETTQRQVTDDQGRPVTVDVPGNLVALLVLVPRQSQELLQFAIDNGSVRVSLLSAQVQAGAEVREPSLGVVYNDMVALIELDRQRAMEEGLPAQIMGPGADMYQQPDGQGQGVTVDTAARPSVTPEP